VPELSVCGQTPLAMTQFSRTVDEENKLFRTRVVRNSSEEGGTRAWIIGLGSPVGDDRIGWDVVEQLRELLPPGVRVEETSDPLRVLDCPLGCELLIVIDACCGAGPPGSFHRFAWPDAQLMTQGGVSSHGVGLATALELGGLLGKLPPRIVVFAIEAASTEVNAELSRQVESALPAVVALVLTEIARENAMNDPPTLELLKTLAFLTPATDDELRLLIPATRCEQYPPGKMLFHEGQHIQQVYIVTTGTVALEINGPDHRPQRFQTVGSGELLGWTPILSSGPMTASARTLTDVQVVAIDGQTILKICENDPQFGFQFMRRIAAAIAARLSATRLQLLDVYGAEIPRSPVGGWL